MEYTGNQETYENIEIEDLVLTIEGYVDGDSESSDPSSKVEYYFLVTKATTEIELGGKTFISECSKEFLKKLNKEYEQEIIEQIKEG